MKNSPKIVCFGEILWDIFPNKKVIGGAPLNVALRLHSQGHSVGIISRIGDDENGTKALNYLKSEAFLLNDIQKDDTLKTGEVLVSLNEKGTASYEITKPVAWDAIEFSSLAKKLVKNAEIFIFGSLVCRGKVSRDTLLNLLKLSKFSVFDVNLRSPFYSIDLILQLAKESQFVKMNDEELQEIASNLHCPFSELKESAAWFMEKMNLKGICITLGEKGAFILYGDNFYSHNGFKIIVKDTVGAGDSFLATLIGELFFHKTAPQQALARACAVGSLVASKSGANCKLTENEIKEMLLETKN